MKYPSNTTPTETCPISMLTFLQIATLFLHQAVSPSCAQSVHCQLWLRQYQLECCSSSHTQTLLLHHHNSRLSTTTPHLVVIFSRTLEQTMGSGIQQYCLRWNNHRSNLLLVFEHLFQTEAFTDVTLACDGSSIKCHKMVLAACSSYFQQLFMENDCRHPIVILKDIKSREIKAILEYMYKGEVNVAQDQLAGLLKAAETLKVKGLVEDNHNVAGTATPTPPSQSPYQSHSHPPSSVSSNTEFHSTPNTTNTYSKSNNSVPTTPKYVPNDSPVYDAQYNASSYPDKNSIPFHLWPSTNKLPLLSSSSPKHAGSNNYDNSQNEPVPLKKKFMGPNKDTPILRTVLGHTALQQHNSIDSQSPSHYQQHQQPLSNQNTPPYKSPYMPVTTNGPTEHSNDKVSECGREMIIEI